MTFDPLIYTCLPLLVLHLCMKYGYEVTGLKSFPVITLHKSLDGLTDRQSYHNKDNQMCHSHQMCACRKFLMLGALLV